MRKVVTFLTVITMLATIITPQVSVYAASNVKVSSLTASIDKASGMVSISGVISSGTTGNYQSN